MCRRLAKTLGQAGEIEPETEGILMEYDVDFSEFSDDVLACLPQNLPWTIPPEELARRRDLRCALTFKLCLPPIFIGTGFSVMYMTLFNCTKFSEVQVVKSGF